MAYMARTGRPKAELVITEQERSELERLAGRSRSARTIAFRAKIVLRCAEGLSNAAVSRQLRATPHTVGKWRRRFVEQRVEGLLDEPRPGAPRQIGDEKIEEVIVKTLETTPKGATHWSRSLMARKSGLSSSTIGRIWRAFGLQPHRSETFQVSTDPLLIEKVRDIVGLYMNPPDHALVLSVDEKSQIQALNRTQPKLPMRPGQPERGTHNYERHGTTSLFAALDIATGNVIGRCYNRHRAKEFRKFLNLIEESVPPDVPVHLIVDNYSTHKTQAIQRWLAKRPRFHVHFTPTHASWLNQVERWFALLTQRQIKRGSHTSVVRLKRAIQAFIDATNEHPKPFIWTKTADDILKSIARFATGTLKIHA